MADVKSRKGLDVSTRLAEKRGNGILRREGWGDAEGKLVRDNLAYINHDILQGDNGRVGGYDNSPRRASPALPGQGGDCGVPEFRSFEGIEERFEADWAVFSRKRKI